LTVGRLICQLGSKS